MLALGPQGIPLTPTVNLGDNVYGGYAAGVIDTTVGGSIIASDASQTGARYLLIVAPKSLETTGLVWKTAASSGPSASQTRWNGLAATTAMASSTYPAAKYCYDLTYPGDGNSRWYLPALDELEVFYRALKATAEANKTGAVGATGSNFPPTTFNAGVNPSSSPQGATYTSTVPAITSVAEFAGGAQALGATGTFPQVLTSTEYAATFAWIQVFSGGFNLSGSQSTLNKTSTSTVIRPVRRVLI